MGVRHLYVHLPFCASRCGYCAFVVDTEHLDLRDAYLDALLLEFEQQAGNLGRLETVYLGGGTPSMMGADRLVRLLDELRASLAPGAEVSIEVNPETLTPKLAERLVAAGANRISLGVQSLRPEILARLDRQATPEDARRAVAVARQAGFTSLSLDLLFAVPGQDEGALMQDIAEILDLAPDHISWYELELKPGSRLATTPGISIDEDFAETAYERIVDDLQAAGFEWYELANFARPGHQCRHSLSYWGARDHVGLGVGAFGTVGSDRRHNAAGLRPYIDALTRGERAPGRVETLDEDTRRRERWMLALRLNRPMDRGLAGPPDHPEALVRLEALGLLTATASTVQLTRAGRFLQNAVMSELMDYA